MIDIISEMLFEQSQEVTGDYEIKNWRLIVLTPSYVSSKQPNFIIKQLDIFCYHFFPFDSLICVSPNTNLPAQFLAYYLILFKFILEWLLDRTMVLETI